MFYIFYSRSLKTKTRKLKFHRHEFDWSHSYLAQAAVISAWCLKEHRPGRWDAEWVDYCLGPIGIAALKLIPQRRESPIFLCRFGSSLCGVFFRVFLEPPDIFVGFPALIMPGMVQESPLRKLLRGVHSVDFVGSLRASFPGWDPAAWGLATWTNVNDGCWRILLTFADYVTYYRGARQGRCQLKSEIRMWEMGMGQSYSGTTQIEMSIFGINNPFLGVPNIDPYGKII